MKVLSLFITLIIFILSNENANIGKDDQCTTTEKPSRLSKIAKMNDWILQNGGYINPSFVPKKYSDDDYYDEIGIFYDDEFDEIEFQVVSKIPGECIVTLDEIFRDEIIGNYLKSFYDHLKEEGSNIRSIEVDILSLYIIYVKYVALEKKSFFYPYVDALPETFRTWRNLVNHTKVVETLRKYGSPYVADMFHERVNRIVDELRMFRRFLGKNRNEIFEEAVFVDLEVWFWAYSSVETRNFQSFSSSEDVVHRTELIPFLDLFNHKFGADIAVEEEEKEQSGSVLRIDLISKSSYQDGQEIFNDYYYPTKGNNIDLFRVHGFIVPENDDQFLLMVMKSHDEETGELFQSEINFPYGHFKQHPEDLEKEIQTREFFYRGSKLFLIGRMKPFVDNDISEIENRSVREYLAFEKKMISKIIDLLSEHNI